MEAAVADKEVGAMEWSDGRLDELSKKVDDQGKRMDEGFARLDKKMDEGFTRMDAKFEQMMVRMDVKFDSVNERFEGLHRMLFKASWALVIGLLGLLGVLAGIIATQG
jgi:hypothetical protein